MSMERTSPLVKVIRGAIAGLIAGDRIKKKKKKKFVWVFHKLPVNLSLMGHFKSVLCICYSCRYKVGFWVLIKVHFMNFENVHVDTVSSEYVFEGVWFWNSFDKPCKLQLCSKSCPVWMQIEISSLTHIRMLTVCGMLNLKYTCWDKS